MNALEHELEYPYGETLPEPGRSLEVAPGVRWVRMGLPFALDHINLWLLRDELDGPNGKRQGWSIVDCGIANEATRSAWEQVFASPELDGLPVLRVIVTHLHPDHIGLAAWLTERWSTPEHECRLWISGTDYNGSRMSSNPASKATVLTPAFAKSHGITDAGALEMIGKRGGHYATLVPKVPDRFRRLVDGDVLRIGGRDWRCHVGYGHAPEHISLHCAESGVLISGDMVLPRISTNVGVHENEPEGDPLKRYLDSVERMRALPADSLVLPSHGRPFKGLHTRIDQLQQHHDERLADVMQACREAPQSAADMLPVLFRRTLDLHQTTFAMGESIAHLNALWHAGKLVRRHDADGVYRYAAA